jgi:putative hemolysin
VRHRPKSLALGVAESYALWTAGPVALLAKVAQPLVWLLTTSSNLVLRLFGDRTDFMESRLTRDDLQAMVGEAQTSGSLDAPTGRLVSRALEFTRLQVQDVMVHRRNVATVQRGASPDQLREALLATPHRRVMVIDGTADQACGYLLRDDVLSALWSGRAPKIEDLLRPPIFVPETTSAERAFRDLQDRGSQFAMVVDETGGVAGIVTIEDLVEELVGEIFDELDHRQVRAVERESARSWLMAGSVDLRTLTRELGFQLPAPSGVRTIGGLCVELAGSRIPAIGETFEIGAALTAEVVDASPRRVRLVRLRIPDAPRSAR